ncbi:MAG: ATP-dependent 6-phosphofructokinase [Desulfobacteraceae bacterium]|nr:ATP-dependent 6-phosphofructokinase [Pseudomonadota bacterium]MBU4259020.1 ATP-dependent 6-phosphofructokinase [Pseudomonadota bacterium]MBU4414273.1 ATP-dependent 6-phosphofructokinase [Pseudomonadota bacterium]MCG2757494.1 ATP-dependent 6-phosphofructokinase [Desulfobacteraceae bacterium]
MDYNSMDTEIEALGEPKILSPLGGGEKSLTSQYFIPDNTRILIDIESNKLIKMVKEGEIPPSFEKAGPRSKIFFDPSKLRCAIVTCGGLCPGVNDIIRSIVFEIYYSYGVQNIYGIRYGLQGFIPKYGHDVINLKPESVVNILEMGGSILGSSRGAQSIEEIVNTLKKMNIGILFMIGGDGTLMAATKITDAIKKGGLKISVVGIPKTIDNDIFMVSRTFGFDTAVDIATQAIKGAHNEAIGYPNGIGLIKLMGRYSGFIAATSALAQQNVNFVLIPEVDFDLEGPKGFLNVLEKRLHLRKHAVIVVAEGAGQKFFETDNNERDESGNIRPRDIGWYLKDKITSYFESRNIKISLKYIDPSYMIRSVPANANDHIFCSFLGRDAVHAGMAGKTRLLIGHWNNYFVHIPMSASAGKRKKIDPNGKLWLSVLHATGQDSFKNE